MADPNGDHVEDILNEGEENDDASADLLGEEEQDSEVTGDDTQGSLANDESALLSESNYLDDTNDEAVSCSLWQK